MSRWRTAFRNLGLVAASAGLVIVLSLIADRAIPLVRAIPSQPACVDLGVPPNSVLRQKTLDFAYSVHTNSLGLRGRDVDLDKGDKFRIVAIGSSYTYGWGVNDDEVWVNLLERDLRAQGIDVEVLNLGRNGGSPPQYAVLAEEAVPLLRPDLILVAIGQGCDLAWSYPVPVGVRLKRVLKRMYPNIMALLAHSPAPQAPRTAPETPEETAASLAASQEGLRALAASMQAAWDDENRQRYEKLDAEVKDLFTTGQISPGVIDLAVKHPEQYAHALDVNEPGMREHKEVLADHLRAIRDCGGRYGAPTLALSIPFGAYVNDSANANCRRVGLDASPEMLTSSAPDDPLREASSEAGIPFFSATDAFRAQRGNPRLFFQYDLHLAAEGQVLYEKTIAPWIAGHIAQIERAKSPR